MHCIAFYWNWWFETLWSYFASDWIFLD